MRQHYLNEMGIVSWRQRECDDDTSPLSGFIYQIEAPQRRISFLAACQVTAEHPLQKASALVTAICNAISDSYQGEYSSCLDASMFDVSNVVIILGEQCYQQCLPKLNGVTIIYSKYTINDLISDATLKSNIWSDIFELTCQ